MKKHTVLGLKCMIRNFNWRLQASCRIIDNKRKNFLFQIVHAEINHGWALFPQK